MVARGREPQGDVPLSNAERQARYRARHKEPQAAARIRRPVDRRSRIQRWDDGVAGLIDLQAYYAAWLEALPESLRGTATAEALQAIVDLDLDTLAAIEPPRGYGRD
jgi:hypothetical protein